MRNGPPFDVWDGEELEETDAEEPSPAEESNAGESAEEGAMHLDVESLPDTPGDHAWSVHDRADGAAEKQRGPVRYFADEQPDGEGATVEPDDDGDDRVDLETILERQHYSFKQPKK